MSEPKRSRLRSLLHSVLSRICWPFVLGCVSALGFEPHNLWPLTLIAVAALIDRIAASPTNRAAFLQGFCFATGQFLFTLSWIAKAFTYQANMPAWLGVAAVIALSLYLALFTGAASVFPRFMSRKLGLPFVVALAVAWMLLEWVRSFLLTGFAWNPLGIIWVSLPPIAQGASVFGSCGLSGMAVLMAGLLCLVGRRHWRPAIALALTVAAFGAFGFGYARSLRTVETTPINLRIVQPNISQDQRAVSSEVHRFDAIFSELSTKAGSQQPKLVLWPEAATAHVLDLEPKARTEISALLGPNDILLTGSESVVAREKGTPPEYHNSVFALDSQAALLWRYDKAHLVPFGEYLPLRPLLSRIGLSRVVAGTSDFTVGPGPRTFRLPNFPSVGVQICYEIIFAAHVVDSSHRPDLLFNPSNDAWFGESGPPQHLAHARLRAIEEGLPIVRSTPNGISAVISSRGELLASIPQHRRGTIDTLTPPPLPPTIFATFGHWATVVFALCLILVGAGHHLLGKRRPAAIA